jgi:methionyl aminopeptidase
MIFTIEPMINAGKREIKKWRRLDHRHQGPQLSAQWEHTVLVTETGYEVLTLSAGSPPPPAFVTEAASAPAAA